MSKVILIILFQNTIEVLQLQKNKNLPLLNFESIWKAIFLENRLYAFIRVGAIGADIDSCNVRCGQFKPSLVFECILLIISYVSDSLDGYVLRRNIYIMNLSIPGIMCNKYRIKETNCIEYTYKL